MKNLFFRRQPARYFLLLFILPLGCLLIQDGGAESASARLPEPHQPVFQPPLGPGKTPIETVTAPPEGGIVTLNSGTEIAIPADAFIDSNGQVVTRPVTLTIQEYLNPLETWLGGVPMNIGEDNVLRSAGMMEIRGSVGHDPVELGEGKSLQLDWYSVDDNPEYLTWTLDTASGAWTQTNGDIGLLPRDLDAELAQAEAALPPRVDPAPLNRYAFDIGDMTGKQPGLRKYAGVQFVPIDGQPCGHDATRIEVEPITDGSGGAFNVKFILDTVMSARFKASSFDTTTYRSSWRLDTTTVCRCNLGLPPNASERLTARIQRLLNGDTERQRERGRQKALALWSEYNAEVERQFLFGLLRPDNIPAQPDRPGRILQRSMQLDQLGWINCDIVIPYPTAVDLVADFVGADGKPVSIDNLSVLELDTRTLYPCKNNRIRLDPTKKNTVFGYANGQVAYLDDATIAQLSSSASPTPLVVKTATISELKEPSSTIAQLILGS